METYQSVVEIKLDCRFVGVFDWDTRVGEWSWWGGGGDWG